jgi:hypothetical protein
MAASTDLTLSFVDLSRGLSAAGVCQCARVSVVGGHCGLLPSSGVPLEDLDPYN